MNNISIIKNNLIYLLLILLVGGCKVNDVEPETSFVPQGKARVQFHTGSGLSAKNTIGLQKQASNNYTKTAITPVEDMAYSVFVFDKVTESLVMRNDMVRGHESDNPIYLDAGNEYIFVAVSLNKPVVETLTNEYVTNFQFRRKLLHKSLLDEDEGSDYEYTVLDSVILTEVSDNANQIGRGGFGTYNITYYDKVDDFGIIDTNRNNLIQFDLEQINFVLDVHIDMSELSSLYDYFHVSHMYNRIESPYAYNDHACVLSLYDGAMYVDPSRNSTSLYSYSDGYMTNYTTNGIVTYSNYLYQEDTNGKLILTITYSKDDISTFKTFEINRLHFKPGHRSTLRVKVHPGESLSLTGARIEYEQLDDVTKEYNW